MLLFNLDVTNEELKTLLIHNNVRLKDIIKEECDNCSEEISIEVQLNLVDR